MRRPELRVLRDGEGGRGAVEVGDAWGLRCRRWPRRTLGAIGRFVLLRLGVSRINPIQFDDGVTGEQLTISRSARYLIISYAGRDYCFDPLTGELEGTGSLMCCG